MSSMSKTLLKLISAVLAIYILVAAFPILKLAYQNYRLDQNPTSLPPTATSTPIQLVEIPATSTPTVEITPFTPQEPTLTPTLPTILFPEILVTTPAITNVPEKNSTYTIHLPLVGNTVEYDYQEQDGVPVYTQNFAHSAEGCNWLSVAGQVFDGSGNPVDNLIIDVMGTLGGDSLDYVTMTGLTTDFGPGGFEIQLADEPIASTGTLTIQVFDLEGNPLSAPISFDTLASCSQNVVIINFAP